MDRLDANHLANEGVRAAAVIGSSPQPGGSLARWIQQQAENHRAAQWHGVGLVSRTGLHHLPGESFERDHGPRR